jgi:23S rRNA (adenine-N6)-dimethyltransferase
VGARERRSRLDEARPSGQHLLRSHQLAREIVAQAGIGPKDLVVDIGAGTGRLTEALASSAGRVVAIELDPSFVATLRRRFHARAKVAVVEGDVLRVTLPGGPFRAFGNIPFGLTTRILRRLLDDPTSALVRADLIVEYDVARKRSSVWPSNLVSLGWLPWREFQLARRLPARAFEPAPAVDAPLLSVTKRTLPLIPPELRPDYVALVGAAFRRADLPVHRSLRGCVPDRTWRRTARERGLTPRAKVRDLDVFDWTALFLLLQRSDRDCGRLTWLGSPK